MLNRTGRQPLIFVLLVFAAIAAMTAVARGAGESADPPAAVHTDAAALEQAAVDTARAFLLEDAEAAREALDRVEGATRRLDRERDAALGDDLLTYEQGFHVTLDRAREMAGKQRLEEAFNHFVWVQRACITCHGIAREQGLLPAGPIRSASRGDSESPNPASEARPSQ